MAVDVIIGLQRGDEGKGRFVDMLSETHDIVARFNGGNNAGHTVVLPDGRDLALHLVPSGIAHPHAMNIIGNGTLINPVKLNEEIADIKSKGINVSRDNLKISSAAHLILPHHIYDDEIRESGKGGQGSTKAGIAQVSSGKSMRTGVRTEIIKNDLKKLAEIVSEGLKVQRPLRDAAGLSPIDEEEVTKNYVENAGILAEFITDTVFYLNQQLRKPQPAKVLAEGAQAFLLDIDHGMYPYTSSSSTTAGGVASGLGVPASFIDKVTGVAKAVQSHVGGGPFVTEISDKDVLQKLHGDMSTIDAEKGTTTGRIRRLGCFDLPQVRRALMVNGEDDKLAMALSKLDWVQRFGEKIPICVAYERKGKTLEIAPDAAYKLEQSKPIYEYLPNWTEDIRGVRKFENLPKNAQDYIKFIEGKTGVSIKMIGVGPQRDQVIIR
ncbi:MAG: adenylosuccinate synthase [Candidatus Saccharibacteria bacterium]|nr:adenylosuccinate synthase [Candidatus Saccharibacteria bacterium]